MEEWSGADDMHKDKGSWSKIGAVTAGLSVCLGLAYGVWATNQDDQARYKRAMEFSFANEYGIGTGVPATTDQVLGPQTMIRSDSCIGSAVIWTPLGSAPSHGGETERDGK